MSPRLHYYGGHRNFWIISLYLSEEDMRTVPELRRSGYFGKGEDHTCDTIDSCFRRLFRFSRSDLSLLANTTPL